jgi:urease accessory protein
MTNKLQITAGIKNGRTILKDCFFTQPFRVVNISEDRKDPSLHLVIMSSSPGLLNDDQYLVDINVETGAEVKIQSQAYQRIFKMKGSASIQQHIDVGKNSTLYYIPHPVVPHNGSTLVSETHIKLTEGSRLVFSDILTCGRKHSGEIFQYASYINKVTVNYGRRLIYKDNVILQPAVNTGFGIGQFEGYTHQAGFLLADARNSIVDALPDAVYEILQKQPSIQFGITRVHQHLLAGRILGMGGEQLYTLMKEVEQYVGKYWNMKQHLVNTPESVTI